MNETRSPLLAFEAPTGRPSVPLKLAVDVTAVRPARKGLGRFQLILLQELSLLEDQVELIAICGGGADRAAIDAAAPNATVASLSGTSDLRRSMVQIPHWLRRQRPDAYVTTTDRLLVPAAIPAVLYVFEHPAYRTVLQRTVGRSGLKERAANALTRAWFRQTVRRADRIIAASTSTARDLVFFGGADPRRVSIAMPGPFISSRSSSTRRGERVVAFVDRDPRDNGIRLLDAFGVLPEPWTLDVIGDARPEVRKHAAATLPGRVSFHGRVTDEVLVELLETATVLLDASMFEGFGAQIADGAAAGLAVIAPWVTSGPEVAGHHARFVNPHRTADIRAALLEVTAMTAVPAERAVDHRWSDLAGHVIAAAVLARQAR